MSRTPGTKYAPWLVWAVVAALPGCGVTKKSALQDANAKAAIPEKQEKAPPVPLSALSAAALSATALSGIHLVCDHQNGSESEESSEGESAYTCLFVDENTGHPLGRSLSDSYTVVATLAGSDGSPGSDAMIEPLPDGISFYIRVPRGSEKKYIVEFVLRNRVSGKSYNKKTVPALALSIAQAVTNLARFPARQLDARPPDAD